MKIVSRGFTEGFYYKPRVDYEVLEEYKEGLIALSACLAGEVATYIRENNYEKAKNTALRLQDSFWKRQFLPGTARSRNSRSDKSKHGTA